MKESVYCATLWGPKESRCVYVTRSRLSRTGTEDLPRPNEKDKRCEEQDKGDQIS